MKDFTRKEWRRGRTTLEGSVNGLKIHSFREGNFSDYTAREYLRIAGYKEYSFKEVYERLNYTRFECVKQSFPPVTSVAYIFPTRFECSF
jgi:hypothetical protein